ncbi:MAG: PilZ domain-containing protein [Gammaproteobacteria bacterium]|nr:PilZ domain-containing protein [Gammaproteobacteria bacterium]
MSTEFVEKRSEPRLELDIPIGYRIDGASEFEDGILVNMSNNGLLMYAVEPIPVGANVDVLVDAEDEQDEPLLMHTEIIRIHPGQTAGFNYACRVLRHETPGVQES